MNPVTCGIVGIHGYAHDHLDRLLALQERGLARVVGAVAHDPGRDPAWADHLRGRGVRLLPDLDALLAGPGPELVTLPVGIHLHVPFARRALAAGRHVYLEKPVAGTLAEGLALGRAADTAGRRLFIGFQDLCTPGVRRFHDHLLAGGLGRVRRIVAVASWPRGDAYYRRTAWAGQLVCDGVPVRDSPMQNACAHFLALALLLAGDRAGRPAWPLAVEGGLWRARPIPGADTALLRVATDTGVEVVFAASHAVAADWGPRLRVEGDGGTALCEDVRGDGAWRCDDGTAFPLADTVDGRFASVVEAIRGRPHGPVCPLEMALPHSAAVDLAHAVLPIRDLDPARCTADADGVRAHPGVAAVLAAAWERGAVIAPE